MPRPSIDTRWVERVWELKASNPKLSGERIAKILEPEGGPSGRQVRRILTNWHKLGEDERRRYELFRWPESMEIGEIPWEASRALLDLQMAYQKNLGSRLTNRFALWYWRVSQVMPDATVISRLTVALTLNIWARVGRTEENAESLQIYLAFAPWRSPEAQQTYEAQLGAWGIEDFRRIPIEGFEDAEDLMALLGMIPRFDTDGSTHQQRQSSKEGEL